MQSFLRDLCVQWTSPSGKLELWLIAFGTMKVNKAYSALAEVLPRDEWTLMHYTLANFNSFVVDVTVGKGASPIEKAFGLLWKHRDDDMATQLALFEQFYGDRFYDAFSSAFTTTRDTTFDAPAELRAEPAKDADPEPSPASTPSSAA